MSLAILFAQLFRHADIDSQGITDVIISCVVPPMLRGLREMSERFLQLEPLVVGPGLRTGMPIRYDNPREVGADRIVNAVAAYEQVRQELIVVDFGTATTFDAVSREGNIWEEPSAQVWLFPPRHCFSGPASSPDPGPRAPVCYWQNHRR